MANPALLVLLALLLSTSLQASQGKEARRTPEYVPVRAVVYQSVALPATDEASGGGGGGYEPFELCMACRCCSAPAPASDGSGCVDTRCCYAIDCDIPGKPFGVCAFSPHTCGCGQADNCTAHSS